MGGTRDRKRQGKTAGSQHAKEIQPDCLINAVPAHGLPPVGLATMAQNDNNLNRSGSHELRLFHLYLQLVSTPTHRTFIKENFPASIKQITSL